MRIVGGELRGRALASPGSHHTRPTSDRTREALFNILTHGYGERLAGARVLDLFAGTGALGLEALSRGAAFAVFVEERADARALIRDNIEALGLLGRTKILRRDATRLGEIGSGKPFDLVFADPPYGKGLAERALAGARAGGWLAERALVVVEESAAAAFAPVGGFALLQSRSYGDTVIHLLERA